MRIALLLILPVAALAQAPLDCGVVKDATINTVTNQFYFLNAQQGDALVVRVLYDATDPSFKPVVSLLNPINATVTARSAITQPGQPGNPLAAGATIEQEYDIVQGGPHQIRVQNGGQTQGSYRIVYTWLNKPCSTSAALACGASASKAVAQPLQLDTYQFAARQGDVVSARIVKVGTAAQGFRATLVAFAPNGQRLPPLTGTTAYADVSASGPGRIDVRMPADGSVTLVVFDAANTTGTYAVSAALLNRSCGTGAPACATPVQAQIAGPLVINSFSLAGVQNDLVSIRTAVADGSPALTPFVEVYDSQGNAVSISRARLPVSSRNVTAWNFTATSREPYVVLVHDTSGLNTGGYSITRVPLNHPCEGSPTLSCGSIVDASIGGLLAAKTYLLASNPNDVFLLRLLNTTQSGLFRPQLDIYDALGNNVQTLSAADLARATFTTRGNGPYSIVVGDGFDNSQTGSYTLALVRLNSPCNVAGALSCGVVAPDNFSRPLDTRLYTYSASAGQSFTVRMIDTTGNLQEALEVYDASGNLVGPNSSNPFAGVDISKAAAGVYTVVAFDTSRRQAGGPFALDLLQTTNACAAPAAQGATVPGVVSATKPFVSYSIPATAGDALLIRSASFNSGFSALMDLYDPSGTRLDSANFGLSRKAPATGTYTVVVGGLAPRTAGAYSLSWQLLNNPANSGALACGGSTQGLLTPSGEFRYYTANASAGDVMRLIFTRLSDNFSPQVEIYDPGGARLPVSTSDITQKAGSDGNYLVVVGPSTANGETGTYNLAYQRANRPCNAAGLTCGQTSLRTVSVPAQLDTWTFTGAGGDQTSIRLTPRSGSYTPFGELYDTAGNRLAASGSTGLLRAVLPSSGPYTVLVHDLNSVNTGSYRLSLQDDTHACAVADSEPPVITLLQPTGGEVIVGGTSFHIQWQSDDNVGVTSHTLALSTDGGKTFATTFASGLGGNQQSYDWTVPPDIAPSRNAVIQVTAADAAGNSQSAASGPVSIIGSGFTPNSTASLTYDGLNRVTQVLTGDGRTIQYTFDAGGNLLQITITQ
jgi:YD repeat-containing protein